MEDDNWLKVGDVFVPNAKPIQLTSLQGSVKVQTERLVDFKCSFSRCDVFYEQQEKHFIPSFDSFLRTPRSKPPLLELATFCMHKLTFSNSRFIGEWGRGRN